MASKLITCKDCGKEVSKNAETCPNCGAKLKKKKGKRGCLGLTLTGKLVPQKRAQKKRTLVIDLKRMNSE